MSRFIRENNFPPCFESSTYSTFLRFVNDAFQLVDAFFLFNYLNDRIESGCRIESDGSFSSRTDVAEDVVGVSAETHPSILRLARACEVGKLLQRRLTSIIITVA